MTKLFDQDMLDLFWDFCHNRNEIWYKRQVLQEPWPWTDDPILQQFSFTNVYRELDPGTRYVIDHILDTPHHAVDRAWNNLLYRVIGRKRTHELLGFQFLADYDREKFEAFLRELEFRNISWSSIAYLTTSFSGFEGKDKIAKCPRALEAWKEMFPSLFNKIHRTASSPLEVYNHLMTLPSVGNFYAYQISVDWSYLLPSYNYANFLGRDKDFWKDWVRPGPGTIKGLWFLTKMEHPLSLITANGERMVKVLHRMHREELEKRGFKWVGLGFDTWHRGNCQQFPKYLSCADLANCLCEWHKYYKTREGFGKMRRRFVPPHLRTDTYLQKEASEIRHLLQEIK